MSLPAREQRILDRIECELRAGDPGLAAELSAFGGQATDGHAT